MTLGPREGWGWRLVPLTWGNWHGFQGMAGHRSALQLPPSARLWDGNTRNEENMQPPHRLIKERTSGQRRNQVSDVPSKPTGASDELTKRRGRRHFPPAHGRESGFRPHIAHVKPKLTETDLDWKSRLRWLPEPRYSDAPLPHIKAILFPEETRLLRSFPQANMRTQSEWTFYPNYGQPTVFHTGKRCIFDGGLHYRSSRSCSEATLEPVMMKKRQIQCSDCPSNAGKPYLNPEYSPDFHKFGSTGFGSSGPPKADTLIPLFPVVAPACKSYEEKRKIRQRDEEILEVRKLNEWRPATPVYHSSLQDEDGKR